MSSDQPIHSAAAQRRPREVAWEGPEHNHTEKGNDWYWALGILTIAGSIATIVFGNVLFGIVILLAGMATALVSSKPPQMITFSVSPRGIRIQDELHPYSTLKCFFLNEDHPDHVQLLVRTNLVLMPLLIIPVPDDIMEDIEYILSTRLPEEHIEEPLGKRILEFFGF